MAYRNKLIALQYRQQNGKPKWFAVLLLFLFNLVTASAIVVIFLSLGAPNQPGSILIGTIIIMQYLGAKTGTASIAIIIEVFFGIFQNVINVTGSIVTLAINDRKSAQI